MIERFVSDTSSIIHYFSRLTNVFEKFEITKELSTRAEAIIADALLQFPSEVRLSIPSIVFVEIYEKWLVDEEVNREFYYEVYQRIIRSPNIEIKPVDQEVVENVVILDDNLKDHDLHDKIIFASAMTLECRLISRDSELIKYNNKYNAVPEIFY